ncbi:Fanconi anemia group F protein [Leuresthes tenuis]|uniref:Fanconi anemia group F protein n=1 Tax=Leuresthes tenuis TaxID=355514 RepID=UPI003B50E76A
MEAALKNLASTIELLAAAAHSCVVNQWDKQTVSRAFHWAKYCEHIYARFHNNSTIRKVMEKQLQLTNQSLRDAIPEYSEVSFSDLPRCQHLLLARLLSNPELPISILKILFDTKSPANDTCNEYEDITGLCSHMVQCKSACKVLRPLSGFSALGADAEVQGEMLMERLGAMLSQGSDLHLAEHFLCSVLQLFEGAAQHLCPVIAAALLTKRDSATQAASHDFLLDWLQNQHSVLQRMCSELPSTLLKDLAKEHLKFRDAYCGVLKKWASDMEYSLSDGEWVQASTNPTVSFQNIAEHFLALFEACPSVRRSTEDEMHALKISDGDFDVRGLSVWGDLLSALDCQN